MTWMENRVVRWGRVLMPALVGLCLGVAMSLMYAPFSDSSCESYLSHQDPQQMILRRSAKSLKPGEENDMFEPKIREPKPPSPDSAGKSGPGGSKSSFVRPRYASTELGIREKLFVGVVSSKGTINTLGMAVNKTISKFVTRLVFFVDGPVEPVPSGVTLIKVAEGHPHLIPVHMLKFVTEQYPDTYDYYLFLTDVTYLRAEKVVDLVTHISVSQHVHLGKAKGAEAGKPYCHLEGGIILSQSLVDKVKGNLEWCLVQCHHSDQSLNFGKCLIHSTSIGCSTHVGVKQFKVFKTDEFRFEHIKMLSAVLEFNQSHSVFPMADNNHLYRLHRYFCEHDLNVTRQEIEKLKGDVLHMSQFAPGGRDSISWPIGVPEPYKPKNRFDIIRWDYFTETLMYFENDYTNVKTLEGADKLDIQEVIKVSVERLNDRYNNTYLYSKLVNGYRRFDPQRGMEYVLDISLRDTTKQFHEVQKRVQLVRPLGQVEILPMPYVTETTRVHLVLGVGDEDKEGVGTFLDAYAHTCLDAQENTQLLIIFMYQHIPAPGQQDSFSVLKSMIAYYNKKYDDSDLKIEWMALQTNGTFMTDLHLVQEVRARFAADSLLLLCSVGMELATDFFNRIRMNTVADYQVFFPIGFWQYKPNLIYDKKPYPTAVEINNRVGYYDMQSFEHCSFYLSDFLQARNHTAPDDLLDSDLFELFVKYSKLHVFRAVEPALKHRYKQFNCVAGMPPKHYQRCMVRRSHSLATRAQLARLVFEHQETVASAAAEHEAKKKRV